MAKAQNPQPASDALPFDAIEEQALVPVITEDGEVTDLAIAKQPKITNLTATLAHLEEVERQLKAGMAIEIDADYKYWEATVIGEMKAGVYQGTITLTKNTPAGPKALEAAAFVGSKGNFLLGGAQVVSDMKKFEVGDTMIIRYQGTKKTATGHNAKIFTLSMYGGQKS